MRMPVLDLINGLEKRIMGTYQGNFENGKLEGAGSLTTSDWRYEGLFKNNKRRGEGTLYDYTGLETEITYYDDRASGPALIKHPDGRKWQVTYKNGCLDGKGYIHNPETGTSYEGNFVVGEFIGRGIH
jgi:hypothetical protein